MLLGPDPCKEASWILLSRAAKIIGYYYCSSCNPLKYCQPEDQFRVPRATSEAIRELAEREYWPYGPLITRLEVAPRRIAVLSSQASRLYGKSPRTLGYPNDQIYGFYSVLAMAQLDGDVLLDEQVERGALRNYDVLVLPKCDVVTKTMYDEIRKFAEPRLVGDRRPVPGARDSRCDQVRFRFQLSEQSHRRCPRARCNVCPMGRPPEPQDLPRWPRPTA